jgi:DNA ligase D-like protein (predicted 3'-phosphoesterase)
MQSGVSPRKPDDPARKTGASRRGNAAGDRLGTYRRMRDAARTPEPVPPAGPLPEGDDDTFVIQEHHARRLHWDFRLERGGVLVSWAIPKGMPNDPKTNHLAVRTEDHPLEYAEFAGEIPKGEYGGGQVFIWDRGTYETEKWSDREVMIVLHGERVSGRYVLFRTGRGNAGKDWMIHRMDPPADPDAEPLPERIAPMRARERKRLPAGQDGYAFEFAWGGARTLAFAEYGRIRLRDAGGEDVTDRCRWLSALGERLGSRQVLLDGEIVRLDPPDRGSEQGDRREQDGRQVYLIFDLLHLDGRSLLAEPYAERRRRLDGLGLTGPRWQTAPWYEAAGAAVREAAREQGLPGIVAKRLDARYEPDRQAAAWLFIPVESAR